MASLFVGHKPESVIEHLVLSKDKQLILTVEKDSGDVSSACIYQELVKDEEMEIHYIDYLSTSPLYEGRGKASAIIEDLKTK